MFLVNELQGFDGQDLLSFWYGSVKPQPLVFFKQPSGDLVSFQHTYGTHYDSYSLPSVLPPMCLKSYDDGDETH
jgi:hypothetical protein